MQVILLEKVGKLGNIGSLVDVKDGYARNFLIPRKKALRATKVNVEYFEAQRAEIEQISNDKKAAAEVLIEKFNDISVTIVRQAGEDGRLYGSVSSSDIAKALSNKIGEEIHSENIIINSKLKDIGVHQIEVALHSDVKKTIDISISRNDNQAAKEA